MRVAIVGSRNIRDKEEYWYNKICGSIPLNCTEIVSGGDSVIIGLNQISQMK